EQKPERAQVSVEFILNDTRLDTRPARVGVNLQNLVQVFRKIHHYGMPHRLPGEASASTAWQHGDLVATGDVHRGDDISLVPGNDDADRVDLIHAWGGVVQGPGVGGEADPSFDDLTQLFIQRAHAPKPPYPLLLMMCWPMCTCDSCGVRPACSRAARMGSCAATFSMRRALCTSTAARCSNAMPTRIGSAWGSRARSMIIE